MEAVLKYTGAEKIDVIAHSFGVTLARGAIIGAVMRETAHLSRLSDRIANFISIGGPNYGLPLCNDGGGPLCNTKTGLAPTSQYIQSINDRQNIHVANSVFSIWSPQDRAQRCRQSVSNTYVMPESRCDMALYGVPHDALHIKSVEQQIAWLRSGHCA